MGEDEARGERPSADQWLLAVGEMEGVMSNSVFHNMHTKRVRERERETHHGGGVGGA